ncbi:hypothetical protein MARPU_00970 [Marichromatium purpuratum 984]|uniref:Uncharacterized protein n=1 Tax=Marichromatium purpuratum 984 TaxID=765910 RepID=W0E3A7_MARPU|nr:hypothetical protein MARPU_00970 [Marichromatium purpuratum 984]
MAGEEIEPSGLEGRYAVVDQFLSMGSVTRAQVPEPLQHVR